MLEKETLVETSPFYAVMVHRIQNHDLGIFDFVIFLRFFILEMKRGQLSSKLFLNLFSHNKKKKNGRKKKDKFTTSFSILTKSFEIKKKP